MRLVAVLGCVTPPGRLRTLCPGRSSAPSFAEVETALLDLAELRIAFADGRPLDAYGGDTARAVAAIAEADAVIAATPVYRGSLTGALKNLFDHLPVESLEAKPVGLVSMGSSDHHYLGAERRMRDVLSFFGALVAPVAVYLTSADFVEGRPSERANAELDALLADVVDLIGPAAGRERSALRPLVARRVADRAGRAIGDNCAVRVSAKADYAVRAAIELAAADEPLTAENVAQRQGIPVQFLHKIFHELQRARLVSSQRGPDGGQRLARPADEITVADIMRALEGPLAAVRGQAPESVEYPESAEPLQEVWIALRTNIRAVLEGVTLADLAAGHLPRRVAALARKPDSWVTR
jgi:Rrf2 family protein